MRSREAQRVVDRAADRCLDSVGLALQPYGVMVEITVVDSGASVKTRREFYETKRRSAKFKSGKK